MIYPSSLPGRGKSLAFQAFPARNFNNAAWERLETIVYLRLERLETTLNQG